tara:strand:- start:3063 stop:3212 length:150 start_codon:yes stop_codon:yes gene_type:complete
VIRQLEEKAVNQGTPGLRVPVHDLLEEAWEHAKESFYDDNLMLSLAYHH